MPLALVQRELVTVSVDGADHASSQRLTSDVAPIETPRPNHTPVSAAGEAQSITATPAAGERPASMILLYLWILLFGFLDAR